MPASNVERALLSAQLAASIILIINFRVFNSTAGWRIAQIIFLALRLMINHGVKFVIIVHRFGRVLYGKGFKGASAHSDLLKLMLSTLSLRYHAKNWHRLLFARRQSLV